MKKQIIILVTITAKKVTVVLKLSKKTVAQLIADAKSYEDGISKNATTFPTPNPTLANLNVLITNLELATVAASNRTRGAVAIRNAAKKALENALKILAGYVEAIANANPEHSESIVKMANMALKSRKPTARNDFSMVAGKNAGELIMIAKSEKGRVTFNFEISTDISNPANWKSVQNKSIARTTVTGLVRGTLYYGRVSRTDKTGTYQIGTVLSAFAH
ncbi:MAG TPA: hypothetical protein VGO45_00295 [Bacteroidia bacterium]|jgi:hypothetical protein|nr:hypothetical protein [Bacteroidia bacterium]